MSEHPETADAAPFLNTFSPMSFRAPISVNHPNRWLSFAPIAGLAFGLAAILASMACGVDSTPSSPVDPTASSIEPSAGGSTTSYAQTLTGTVTDTNGVAIAGARVKAGSRESLTDVGGRFEIPSVPVDSALTVNVAVSKAGFVPLARLATIAAGKTSQLDLTLKRDAVVATLSRRSGATITIRESGARVIIPNDALVDETGAPPATDVDIHFSLFNPASTDIKAAPGNSIGRAADGSFALLGSIVIGTIEARRGDARFDLRPGASLTLELPVSDALNPSAGREFTLSRYDAARGTWEEMGTARSTHATAEGAQIIAVASISRLGAWNVSLKHAGATDFRCDSVRVVDDAGNAIDNIEISVSQLTKAGESDLAVSMTSARSIAGLAKLAPLFRDARVKVTAQQSVGGVAYAGTLEFVAAGNGMGLDAIFATGDGAAGNGAAGDAAPIVRRSTDCADSLGLELVLRAQTPTTPACAGRIASNGSCIRY